MMSLDEGSSKVSNDVFHDFRPNFEENAAFLKGWGFKCLSKNADAQCI